MRKVVFFLLVGCLLAAGCGAPPPKEIPFDPKAPKEFALPEKPPSDGELGPGAADPNLGGGDSSQTGTQAPADTPAPGGDSTGSQPPANAPAPGGN